MGNTGVSNAIWVGEGNGNPLQWSCLENHRDGGAWWASPSMGSHRVRHDWSDLAAAAAAMQYGLLSWLTGKESTCLRRRHRFDPWLRKIPLNRKWQPTPVFVLGKSHGQRSLAGYSPWGPKELDTTGQLSTHTHNDNVASSTLDLKWSSIKPCHDLLLPVTSRFGFARLVLILVPGQDSCAFNLCCWQ